MPTSVVPSTMTRLLRRYKLSTDCFLIIFRPADAKSRAAGCLEVVAANKLILCVRALGYNYKDDGISSLIYRQLPYVTAAPMAANIWTFLPPLFVNSFRTLVSIVPWTFETHSQNHVWVETERLTERNVLKRWLWVKRDKAIFNK